MVDKDWTLEDALAANEADLAKDPKRSFADPTLPLYQWFALQQLEYYESLFRDDSYYLMTAIRTCANHDLPLPAWVSKAYIQAYDAVNNASEKSWDKVFGRPYKKGLHLKSIRQKRLLKFAVLNEVTATLAMKPSTPIDECLFETIGEKFNIKKTLASEYYYDAKKTIENGEFRRIRISTDSVEIESSERGG